MNNSEFQPYTILISAARPWSLLAGILFYALGCGIAIYLGHSPDWTRYWIGQSCVTLLQISSYFLKAYYDLFDQKEQKRRKNLQSEPEEDPQRLQIERRVLILASTTTLTTGAVMTVLLFTARAINQPTLLILGLAFVLAFFYATPPFRLVYSGYGELTHAILLANLTPALAFLLQTGELHRLLAMLTFPLSALLLAMGLATSLEEYASDIKYLRNTMMTRLGWRRGMNVHNLLVLSAYLLLGGAVILGLPWPLTWPALLTLPLGIFQVWQMIQVANGAKPRWKLISFAAIVMPLLITYLLTFALWTG